MTPILEIQKLSAHYGAIQALREVSLYVNSGEIVTLIGANGAGKSTLLMTLFGNPRASNGKILFENQDITHTPTHEILGYGIAQAPEGRRIFPKMTVDENLLLSSHKSAKKSLEEYVFSLFPRLKERKNQKAGTLSGGEQQMLAIARALMSQPKLLVMDEPSLGLAPILVRQIFDSLAQISKEGTTIFLVEQNAYHALKLANRGYVLVTGEIRLSGTAQELMKNPEVQQAYLGG